MSDVLSRHAISVDDLLRYKKDPLFLRRVSDLRIDVREHGVTFRMKARAQAEELLTTSWTLIHREDVSAAVKADLIKSTVKWAGLEPKGEVNPNENTGGVSITINLDPNAAPVGPPTEARSKPKVIDAI